MAERYISEYLNSGEVQHITVGDNIVYEKAKNVGAEGMFFRMDESGVAELYRMPNSDIVQTVENPNDVNLTTTPQELLTLTSEEIASPDNTTVSFMCDITNTNNRDRTFYIDTLADGTSLGVYEYKILKNETHRAIIVSRGMQQEFPVGTVFSINVYGDRNGDLQINGTYSHSKLRLTYAGAGVTALDLQERDYELEVISTYSGRLTREKIESSLVAFGVDLVKFKQNRVSFYLYNGDKLHHITYHPSADIYSFSKRTTL